MKLPIFPGPMPERPLVSVLTANYNFARFLPQALASVQAQTYGNWEMIICDDGATDGSRALIEQMAAAEPRLLPLFLKRNSGHAAALNACFAASRGEIVSLLDADDSWMTRKLEMVVAAAERAPSAGLLVHPLLQMTDSGRCIGMDRCPAEHTVWNGPAMAALGKIPPMPPCSGVSLRSAVAAQVFPIPEEFRSFADTFAFFSAAALTPTEPVSKSPLGVRLFHSSNTTGRVDLEPDRLLHAARLEQAAFEGAAALSQIPGPWPLPESVVIQGALGRRLRGDLGWIQYRRMLASSPAWKRARFRRRLFNELIPMLPRPLMILVYSAVIRLRQARFQLLGVLKQLSFYRTS
ncbi:MAG: glycosyltransferase family 2 protein [Terriglobales bacterium]